MRSGRGEGYRGDHHDTPRTVKGTTMADHETDLLTLFDEVIATRDGAQLRANVHLPPADGPWPTILALTTYGKDLPFSQGYVDAWAETVAAAPEIAEGTSTRHISFEAPDPERWVGLGYAVVLVDARGVGRSPGVIDNLSATEADDYYDAIEWAADQSWSNGRIGLLGMSYLGAMQWLVASRQPPHLAAIVPWEAFSDPAPGPRLPRRYPVGLLLRLVRLAGQVDPERNRCGRLP